MLALGCTARGTVFEMWLWLRDPLAPRCLRTVRSSPGVPGWTCESRSGNGHTALDYDPPPLTLKMCPNVEHSIPGATGHCGVRHNVIQ